jgi:phosphoglycerate dehydrogenase-like enzyme
LWKEWTVIKNILIYQSVDPAGLARVQALPGVSVRVVEWRDGWRPLPPELLRDQHVLLCKLPPQNFDDLRSLELMQLTMVGFDHLAHLHLGDRPVRVCNARGIYDAGIAEWNVAMMVNLVRDLRGMIRNQEHGVWDPRRRYQQEIRDAVVGLWGYGGIGRETARLAKAMGMTVHVMTRSGVRPRHDTYALPGTGDPAGVLPDRVFVAGQEREFLTGLDFLILALPRTRESTGLIGEAELQALPRTAYLLNPARGPIVQEQALLRALRDGWIRGAALDTHFAYPLPADHPLWRFPNVLLTPHISGADGARQFLGRMWDLFATNVERHLAGQPLLNRVTAEELRAT